MNPGSKFEPTRRFSDRVDNYVRFRPGYPPEVFATLRASAGLGPLAKVADIGSGTAIFSGLLLPHCAQVFGIEPNRAMREAGERHIGGDPRFTSVDGTAENTGLPDSSVDLATAAQAFHWFDIPAARKEFARILRPGGHAALVWNVRHFSGTPFLTDYEALLRRYGTDYDKVSHTQSDEAAVASFFQSGDYAIHAFPGGQTFDFEGLKGRLLSSSYTPPPDHPDHEPMLAELERVFTRNARDGVVDFLHTTKLYIGRINPI